MAKRESIKIGVVGLGTVGSGVVRALRRNRAIVRARCGVDVEVRRVADLDRRRFRALKLPQKLCSTDYATLLEDEDIHIIVELIGGTSAARDVVTSALKAGKHVVTANKALLAEHWRKILSLAHTHRCAVGFESSVMAGVPVIRALEEGLAGNVVHSLLGILNGTSNFILSRMAKDGLSFKSALAEARRLGFCEANAALDIEGFDAAQKLAILGSIALGKWLPPAKVQREGISAIEPLDITEAREQFGYVIRPLAVLKQVGQSVEARVHPTLIPLSHPLAAIENEFNAVLINADTAGAVTLAGRGAGEKPAASGIISDVISVARALNQGGDRAVLPPLVPERERLRVIPIGDVESKFYLRFSVVDRPGVLSFISGILSKHGASIATCHQRGRAQRGSVPVIMITHRAREGAVRAALAEIGKARQIVKRKTLALHIEE